MFPICPSLTLMSFAKAKCDERYEILFFIVPKLKAF